MILKILEKGSTKVYAPDGQVADYLFLGFTDTGTTTEIVVTDPSKEIVEMKIEDDIVTAFRYKGDPVWRTVAGGSGGGDTYKVKVDGTDTADYLENKLQQGTNITITKSGGKLVVNSTGAAELELGETSEAAYRGDRGKIAYDHSKLADGTNPHGTTFANIASKPTTVAGYGITDAVDTSTNQTIEGNKTLNGLITIDTFVGTWGIFSSDLRIGQKASSVSDYKINLYSDGSVRSMLKFTNGFTGQAATDGFDVGIIADGTAEIRQRENLPLKFYTNDTLMATFSETGVTSNLSGTWSTISDERLKENITDINEPIAKVESIAKCVKHYNFINQDKYAKGLRTGYIAQLLAENGLEGHVTQRKPNDEEEGALFGWTYKNEEYEDIEKEFILNENNEQIVKENVVIKTRRVVDKEGEMILGIENNFTPYLFPAFVALLKRVKVLEDKLQSI